MSMTFEPRPRAQSVEVSCQGTPFLFPLKDLDKLPILKALVECPTNTSLPDARRVHIDMQLPRFLAAYNAAMGLGGVVEQCDLDYLGIVIEVPFVAGIDPSPRVSPTYYGRRSTTAENMLNVYVSDVVDLDFYLPKDATRTEPLPLDFVEKMLINQVSFMPINSNRGMAHHDSHALFFMVQKYMFDAHRRFYKNYVEKYDYDQRLAATRAGFRFTLRNILEPFVKSSNLESDGVLIKVIVSLPEMSPFQFSGISATTTGPRTRPTTSGSVDVWYTQPEQSHLTINEFSNTLCRSFTLTSWSRRDFIITVFLPDAIDDINWQPFEELEVIVGDYIRIRHSPEDVQRHKWHRRRLDFYIECDLASLADIPVKIRAPCFWVPNDATIYVLSVLHGTRRFGVND